MTGTLLLDRPKVSRPRDFGSIYDEHFQRVYHYFLSRTGYDHETAIDLAEETFLRAFEHFPEYREQGNLYSTYLMTIAHNVLVNYYRKFKSIPWSNRGDWETNASSTFDMEALTEEKDLVRALTHLTPLERKVINLKYIRGIELKDIAASIGRTEEATKQLLYRTRQKVKHECAVTK